MHIFDELKERGLVFQTTDEEALRKALEEGQVSYYTGYDPTADSLHLGHLVCHLDEPSSSTSRSTNLMRSLAVRLVSLEIRPSKMLNVVSKQKKLYKNGFAPFKGNCLVSSILKMVTIKPKWSTTTIGSEALALSTSFVMSENTLQSML